MKFVLRDDDINYHYTVEQLSHWYEGIIDICPISICIPAFIKGDFFYWNHLAENHLPSNEEDWLKDDKIYPIGDNKELVSFIKRLMEKGQASVSMHGIHHRNDEMEMGEVKGNFIRGAEFYTNRDYTQELAEAKQYLSNLFGIDICSFTPPQNMINEKGLKALLKNDLSLCADIPVSYKRPFGLFKIYGLLNTLKLYIYRIFYKQLYPFILYNKIGFVFHKRLQPGKIVEDIKREFDFAYKKNGVFVLSTHSYGFDIKMYHYDMTMKEALMDILHYSQKFENVEYTTLHDLFDNKNK